METTTTPQTPRVFTQRGAPYFCESCQAGHAPTGYTDGEYKDQTPAQRAAREAYYTYQDHKDRASGTERGEAIKRLRGWLKPGLSSVLITIPHVARSGMSRQMRVASEDGALTFTYNIALACGLRFNRERDALSIGGCGMDMTLALIDDLCHVLWPRGFKCPGAARCSHPREYDYETKTHKPHARRHKADGNYTIKRRTL
jgi:hypothetical protein